MGDTPIHDSRDMHIINPSDSTKKVTTTTDGAKELLDVSLGEDLSFQLQAFTPVFNFSVSSTALNTSTDTSLLSITAKGKVDFVSIAGSNANFEFVFKLDGSEILRIKMSEVGSDLGLANATNIPMWAETANKNFRFRPFEGVDFTTSFQVLCKATGTPTPTVNFLINHRIGA